MLTRCWIQQKQGLHGEGRVAGDRGGLFAVGSGGQLLQRHARLGQGTSTSTCSPLPRRTRRVRVTRDLLRLVPQEGVRDVS